MLEIQKNIETAVSKNQAAMLSELLDSASNIEQSLASLKIDDIDVDSIQIEENE